MNRLIRGKVVLAAALVALSCKGDPTSELRNGPDHLVADPSALYVPNGTSKTVQVRLVDEQGNGLESNFTLGTIGPGITVVEDPDFGLVYNDKGQLVKPDKPLVVQYIVTPTEFTATEFVVKAGGKVDTIPVRTAPTTIGTGITPSTASIGDTITITAPAGLEFNLTDTRVIFPPRDTATIITITANSVSFVPRLTTTSGKWTLTHVSATYAPDAGDFTVTTEDQLTLPPTPVLLLNATNAAVGDTIAVTAPGALRFTPTSVATIPGAGFFSIGPSADSLTFRLLIGPGSDTTVSISNVVISGVPATKYTVTTGAVHLESPPIPVIAPVLSSSTPNINGTVTMTAPAGFKFLPSAKVFFGLDQQFIVSVAPDSNSLVFRAHKAGASGAVTVGPTVFSVLTSVPFTASTTANVTVGATITPLPGTGDLATAPLFTIPDAGKTGGVVDAGPFVTGPAFCSGSLGGPCLVYKFVLTAPRSFSVSASWQGTTDIGVYFTNSAGTAPVGTTGCDAKGAGAAGQPETCSVTGLPAGTYFMMVDSFAPFYSPPNNVDPTDFSVTFTGS